MALSGKREQGVLPVATSVMAACILLFSGNAVAREDCTLTTRAEGVGESWTRELEAARADLAGRKDIDDCAWIRLEPTAAGVRVIVFLKDGRSTERAVSDPLDLRAVATALVLLPSAAVHPATTPDSAPLDPDHVPEHQDHAIDVEGTPTTPTTSDRTQTYWNSHDSSQNRSRIDVGAIGGSRWSGAAPAGSLGLFADVSLSDWVLGAYGRWDGYASMSSSVSYTTQALELGIEAGRTIRVAGTSLAFFAGPSVAALSQKLRSAPPTVYVSAVNPKTGAPIGNVAPSARDGQVVRLGAAIRWTVVSRGRLHLFVSADSEIDMTSDPGNRLPAVFAATGSLPIWSAGLSVGGAVSAWP